MTSQPSHEEPLAAVVVLAVDDAIQVVVVDLHSHPCGQHILEQSAALRSSRQARDLTDGVAFELVRSLASSMLPAPLRLIQGEQPADAIEQLTERELEVLRLITAGYSNQEIAEQLYLSINSIKTYIRTAYRKINVRGRTQAVTWGLRHQAQLG